MIKRLKIRKSLNRYDKFKNSFYQKIQRGFLNLAKKNKSKYQIIDSNKDIEHNKSIIIQSIDKLL
jgi:dTMP kinase